MNFLLWLSALSKKLETARIGLRVAEDVGVGWRWLWFPEMVGNQYIKSPVMHCKCPQM